MTRQIIQIDEEKCNGCGVCATACHEGAIEIVDGKARLMRDDFCDGFGDCLPGCPVGAITFIQKDTLAYDEAAVEENKRQKAQAAGGAPSTAHAQQAHHDHAGGGCPGSALKTFDRGSDNGDSDTEREARQARLKEIMAKMPASSGCPGKQLASFERTDRDDSGTQDVPQAAPVRVRSELRQWPCQIKLVPPKAPFFQGAKLLVAADCTAYAYASFHAEFMRGKITLIGCPKLDAVDYTDKLTQIIALNDVKELLVLRMEVPCCGGLENACVNALKASGKFIPWRVVTISTDGRILE